MEESKKHIWFLAAYAAIITMVYYFKIGGEQYYGFFVLAISIISGLPPVYFGYAAMKYFGIKTKQGKSMLFMTIGMLFFVIGYILWDIYLGAVVSPADIFWLASYPVLVIGVLYGISTFHSDFFKSKINAALLIIITIAVTAGYFKFFPLSWDSSVGFVENLVTYGYVFVDLILALLTIFLIYLVFSGIYSRAWIAIAAGMILTLAGDLYYAMHYETYLRGDLIDLTWFISQLVYAVGFILLKYNAEKMAQTINRKIDKNPIINK